MAAMIKITTNIKEIINSVIADLASNYEICTVTNARTSHGRTTSNSTTTLTRKPVVKETKTEEQWLVPAIGWEPCKSRRADGLTEHWGAPIYNKNGSIDVQVDVVYVQSEDVITVETYKMALTVLVRDQIEECREKARIDIIKGRKPLISSTIQKARRLAAHHKGDKRWMEIRNLVNELYADLNTVAAAAADAKAEIIKELIKADTQITELQKQLNEARREEIRMEEEATSTITEMQKHLRDARGGWLRRQNNVQA